VKISTAQHQNATHHDIRLGLKNAFRLRVDSSSSAFQHPDSSPSGTMLYECDLNPEVGSPYAAIAPKRHDGR
jgi:hypothetical protein